MTTAGAEKAPVVLALDEIDAAPEVPSLRRVLKQLMAMGREPGLKESDMTVPGNAATEAPAVITTSHRNSILAWASAMLPLRARSPEAVLAAAAPLLEWAAQAVTKNDLQNRMAAMSRVDGNRAFQHPAPQEFLAEARAYYGFITETA
jgi:hypothetical protein